MFKFFGVSKEEEFEEVFEDDEESSPLESESSEI